MPGAAHRHRTEVRPVHLGLFTWEGLQQEEWLAWTRTEASDGAPGMGLRCQCSHDRGS